MDTIMKHLPYERQGFSQNAETGIIEYMLAGILNSKKTFVEIGFGDGIDSWEHLVKSDPRFKRPAELYSLCGDSTRAREVLGWQPKLDFTTMVRDMVNADLARLHSK